jgi:hypothetical protein
LQATNQDIDLDDATLIALRVSRADGTCVVDIERGMRVRCVLTFSAVSELSLPRKQNWGRSVSINSFSRPSKGHYEIEMQSVDLIKIEASAMTLTESVQDQVTH